MKKIIAFILFTFTISSAEYVVHFNLSDLFGSSIVFKDDTEKPTSNSYKVNIISSFANGEISTNQPNNPNYISLMMSNWIGETAYFVIQSKNFSGLNNAYFNTQSTGPHPLTITQISTLDDDRYFYSLTSSDPMAPPFDIDSEDYEYIIEFDVINNS